MLLKERAYHTKQVYILRVLVSVGAS